MCLAYSFLLQPAYSQQKLGQSGLQFLSVGIDARATGMGEAFTTMRGSSASLFYNPAGIAEISSLDIAGSQMKWIADIKYIAGTAAFAPFSGDYGVIGLSFMTVDYGEFNFTRVAQNEQGYEDILGAEKPTAFMAGLAYGRALSDKFSIGGQVKLAYQNLGKSIVPVYTKIVVDSSKVRTDTAMVERDYSLNVLAFDFGTIYKTGLKSLAFGMSISNFSREVRYERESFQLPLTFKIGISMDLMDFVPGARENHSLYVSLDAVHPRSYYEYLNLGAEYTFMNTIVLRGGYVTHHDEYDLTAGVGVRKFGLAVDYSYMPQTALNAIHRISVRYSL
ncbi:MAG: PorV/PorQ family protein [Acidobacteriota bacterium]